MEMVSVSKFSYQKLKNEGWLDDHDGCDDLREKVIGKQRSFSRFGLRTRRLKIRIPRLGRLFFRRKARLVKVAWRKVVKRLKESQCHFGDLFAGNYLFVQVNPTCLKGGGVHKSINGCCIGDLPSRYSLPKIA